MTLTVPTGGGGYISATSDGTHDVVVTTATPVIGGTSYQTSVYDPTGTTLELQNTTLPDGSQVNDTFNTNGSESVTATGPNGTSSSLIFDSSGNIISATINGTPIYSAPPDPLPGPTPYDTSYVSDSSSDDSSYQYGDTNGDLLAYNASNGGGYYS